MSSLSCQKDSCPPPPRPAFFQCPPRATVCPSRPEVSNAVCPSRQQVSDRRCPTWGIEAAAAQDKEFCRRNKLKGALLPFPGIDGLSKLICLSLFVYVSHFFLLSLSLYLSLYLSLSCIFQRLNSGKYNLTFLLLLFPE